MKVKREIQSFSVDKLNRIADLSVCFYTNKEWINCDWRLSKHPLLVSKMFEIKKKRKSKTKQNTKNIWSTISTGSLLKKFSYWRVDCPLGVSLAVSFSSLDCFYSENHLKFFCRSKLFSLCGSREDCDSHISNNKVK